MPLCLRTFANGIGIMDGPVNEVNMTPLSSAAVAAASRSGDRAVSGGHEILVQSLSFAYTSRPVLEEVSFGLERGAVGLLGPNGSGKTTLLRVLLGHLKVAPGAVRVLDQDMARRPRQARRRLGWMPERGGILPGMSGVGMVAYLGELSGMPPRDAMQRAHEVIDYVGLGEARYRPCQDYSQGMRQRLKLAQVLVHDPAWIFLDEPTSGLDPRGRVAMLDLVRDLASRKGFGVLLSTHLLPDVESVCRRVLVLRRGRLLANRELDPGALSRREIYEVEGFGDEAAFLARLAAAGAEVKRTDRRLEVTVGDGAGSALILAAAQETAYGLRRMRRQTVRLEDVFHDLVRE
jgi:ABC-2 type transport system ATP-binding protein